MPIISLSQAIQPQNTAKVNPLTEHLVLTKNNFFFFFSGVKFLMQPEKKKKKAEFFLPFKSQIKEKLIENFVLTGLLSTSVD